MNAAGAEAGEKKSRQTENTGDRFIIREMTEADLAGVRALEEACFSDAWSERLLRDMLDSGYDWCRVLESVPEEEGRGAEAGIPRIAGYVNVRVLADEAELMRICVSEDVRGRGLSHRLLEAGLGDMKRNGAVTASLEVRAGNAAAVRLYESHGFVLQGTRKRYYRDPVEDALIYRLERL